MVKQSLATLVALGAVGCAPQPVPSLAAPVPPLASAAGPSPFDGVYRGRSTPLVRAGRRCSGPGAVTVVIRGGKFQRRISPTELLDATVAADGTISGQAGRASITGTIQGGHLEAEAGGELCRNRLALDRS